MHMAIYFRCVKSCSGGQRWFAVKGSTFWMYIGHGSTAVLIDCPLPQAWTRFVLRYYAVCNVARLFGVGLERSCALNSCILAPCPMQTRPWGTNPWSMFQATFDSLTPFWHVHVHFDCAGLHETGSAEWASRMLPVNFRTEWLLWHVRVHFDCAGSHKTRNLAQTSRQETPYRELVQRSCQGLMVILFRDLAKRPRTEVLPTELL